MIVYKLKQDDLMIGNFVYDNEGILSQIENIESDFFNEWNGADEFTVKFKSALGVREGDVFGIPLTPTALRCLGAYPTIEGSEWHYKLPISAISLFFRFNGGDCYSELGGIYLADKLEFVHQVQNLFKVLTGSELLTNYSINN